MVGGYTGDAWLDTIVAFSPATGAQFQIMPGDGVLRLILDGNPDAELVPEAPGRFFFRDNGVTVRFEEKGGVMNFIPPNGNPAPRIER